MRYSSWDTECDRQKNERSTWRCHHFTQVYQKSRYMLPEILTVTDINFCHFGPFFALHPPSNPKNRNFENIKKSQDISSFYMSVPQMTIIWCMAPELWSETEFFVIFELFFCPFIPLTTQKIKILKKMKKILGDTIILQMCIINQSHMMYGSCNIRHDGLSFRHFGPFFAL